VDLIQFVHNLVVVYDFLDQHVYEGMCCGRFSLHTVYDPRIRILNGIKILIQVTALKKLATQLTASTADHKTTGENWIQFVFLSTFRF